MLNDAAKKQVARAARVSAKEMKDRVRLGASMDELAAEAWQDAVRSNPDFHEWPNAKSYFEAVFYNEVDKY